MTCDAIVLGAGISGLSTAIVLQSLGFQITILAEDMPGLDTGLPANPCVPTGFAMASAYPHHLKVANLATVSDMSQNVFQILSETRDSGVSIYRMFEVFEHEPDPAPLGGRRMKYQEFDGKPSALKRTVNPPARPGANYIWGWTFETYFTDMPLYLDFLWRLFTDSGGIVRRARLTKDVLAELPTQMPLVNCLGLGAGSIFPDSAPSVIVRGRQVMIHGAPMLAGSDNLPVAYNYTPPAEVFSRADGTPEYVHFFPRADGWLLGQTREPGMLDENGLWSGKAVSSPEITIGSQAVPSPIIDLNRSLLQSWMGVGWESMTMSAREGFRFYRDPLDTGVRLGSDSMGGATVVHNYGHGGSGVTMSWGCAIEAARLLSRDHRLGIASPNGTDLQKSLNLLVRSNDTFQWGFKPQCRR